ncbi:transposase [Mesorhizobium sp. AaZ16]|uniref:transposase n=1 Tax=Mesorhizobium sp. AaZ16 TaxID=3402289 RepID=UPI00374E95AA
MTKHEIEVITSVKQRRRWSREEQERLVAATFGAGASVFEIARSAGIHVSQLPVAQGTLPDLPAVHAATRSRPNRRGAARAAIASAATADLPRARRAAW